MTYPMRPAALPHGEVALRLAGDPEWVVQPKLDGKRCILWVDHLGVRAWSRRWLDLRLPVQVALDAAALLPPECLVDCEMMPEKSVVAFDLPLLRHPLHRRLALLEALLPEGGPLRRIETFRPVPGVDPWVAAALAGHEGIVLKRKDSVYTWGACPETETRDWFKVRARPA